MNSKKTAVLISCLVFLPLFTMELQETQREKVLTFIDFLTEQADSAKQHRINLLREFNDPEIRKIYSPKGADGYALWLEHGLGSKSENHKHSKTVLDHIRLDHKWGTMYLQVAPSKGNKTRFVISLFPPYFDFKTWRVDKNKSHEDFLQHINTLFSTETLQKHMSIKASGKHLDPNPCNIGLYTARLDITPWQEFFFELMPWHHKNPGYYALSIATLASLTTWYCTKKYYQK
jgi:hypothetical protein